MDGIYQISMNTPMGKMDGKITLKTNGENIEGILEMMGMRHSLNNGRVRDNQCYFKGNMQNKAVNLQYEVMGRLMNNVLDIYAKTNMGEFKMQGRKIG